MSRCYPYPPPGYVKDGICDEALIESIKIQREEDKAKKERKKEKRDKKEKKQEKKERDKARDSGEIASKKYHHHKRHKFERSREDEKGGNHIKRRENEAESFERSTITEEYGQAVGSQNSSDSTLNSNKRQKLSVLPDSGHNPGSIIRIRLPSQRYKNPDVLPSKEQAFPTLGRTDDDAVQGVHEHGPRPGRDLEEHPCSTASISGAELACKLSKERPSSSSGASGSLTYNVEASLPSNLCRNCSPTVALELKNLVENWVVPTLQTDRTSFVEDWLFQKEETLSTGVRSSNNDGNDGWSQINSPTWPHACYLPEADTYALPFTIPF